MRRPLLAALAAATLTSLAHAAPNEDSAPAGTANQAVTDLHAGALTVDDDGSLGYRIAIELPAARLGMKPALGLTYRSSAGNGLLGMGWSLTGLPAIGRMNRGEGIDFAGADTYGVLPGFGDPGITPDHRLVDIGGGDFHTARQTYARYRPLGSCGDGPCYWVMRDKRGVTFYFGGDGTRTVNTPYTSAGATCVTALAGPNGSVRKWPLYRAVDLDGNTYQIDWRMLGGALVPHQITYNLSSNPVFPYYDTVDFAYAARPDTTALPEATSNRLATITVRVYGAEQHRYELAYQTSPTTGRSRLTSVQRVGGTLRAPAETFAWSDGDNRFEDNYVMHTADTPSSGFLEPGWDSVTGDFDGDGFGNLAVVNGANGRLNVRCARGGAGGLGPLTGHPSNGTAAHLVPVDVPWQVKVGDWNHDGRDNLALAAQSERGRFLFQLPGASVAHCFGALDKSHTNLVGVVQNPARILDGDVDGDGFDDLVFVSMGPDPASPLITSPPRMDGLVALGFLSTATGLAPTGFVAFTRLPSSALQPASLYHDLISRASGWDLMFADWNGDGRSDLAAVYQGRGGRVVLELDGRAGATGMAWSGPGKVTASGYLLAQGDDWHATHQGQAYLEKEWTAFPADLDGDGKSDLVMAYQGPVNGVGAFAADPNRDVGREVRTARGTATGLAMVGIGAENLGLRVTGGLTFSGGTPSAGWTLTPCELNGDRAADLCATYQGRDGRRIDTALGGAAGPTAWTRTVPIASGLVDPVDAVGAPWQWSRWHTVPADITGDGATNLVFTYTGSAGCYVDLAVASPTGLATAIGHPRNTSVATTQCATFDGGGASRFSDLSGDGRADTTRSAGSSDGRWVSHASDVNGDGKADLIFVYHGSQGRHIKLLLARPGRPDLVTEASNGHGGTRTVIYTPIARVANAIQPATSGPGLPDRDPRMLVTAVVDKNGRGRALTTTYGYQDARRLVAALADRTALGFRVRTVEQLHTNTRVITAFNQSPPLHGTVASRALRRQLDDVVIQEDSMVYETATRWPGAVEVRLRSQGTDYYESGTFSHARDESFRYDAWGSIERDERCDDSDCTVTTYEYNNQATATRYLIGQVASTKRMAGAVILDWERYGYWPITDQNHRLTTVERWLCADAASCTATSPGARWVMTLRHTWFDVYGHPLTSYDAAGAQIDHGYEAYSSTFVARETRWVSTNATRVGLATDTYYNPAGRLRTTIDRANNVTALDTQYDALGRVALETRPDGGTTTYVYESWGDPYLQAIYVVTTTAAGRSTWKRSFFDGEGLVYRVDTRGDAGQTVTVDRTDLYTTDGSLGLVHRQETSQPHLATTSATVWTRIDREAATDRPLRTSWVVAGVAAPQRSYTYVAIPGTGAEVRSVATLDARYHSTTEFFDARGRVIRRTDAAGGTMWKSYDAADRPTNVAITGAPNPGVGIVDTYDSFGRVRSHQEPATGVTGFEYDDAGRLTQQVDDNGHVTTFTYDELGRMLTRKNLDGTITYDHDNPTSGNYGWGRLDTVTDASGTSSYAYDVAGRVRARTVTIAGWPAPLTSSASYDLLGRLIGKTMPDGTVVGYHYSDGGNLDDVTLAGWHYVTFRDFDAAGRVGRRDNSNGTATVYTYRPEGYLGTLTTTGPGGAELQRLTYGYDANWNVASVSDGRTVKVMSGVNTDETQSYLYDAVDRVSETATAVFGREVYEYDQLGNLTRKGDHRYTLDGYRATAATSIATGRPVWTAVYDDTGAMLEKAGIGWTWDYGPDADGRTVWVGDGSNLVEENLYDFTGARVKKTYYRPDGSTVTTYYVGDDYELRVDSAAAPGTYKQTRYLDAPGRGRLVGFTWPR